MELAKEALLLPRTEQAKVLVPHEVFCDGRSSMLSIIVATRDDDWGANEARARGAADWGMRRRAALALEHMLRVADEVVLVDLNSGASPGARPRRSATMRRAARPRPPVVRRQCLRQTGTGAEPAAAK